MQDRSASGPTAEDVGAPPAYPADLPLALQAELAVLADIETDYAAKRHDLETWAGSPELKERIIRQLEGRHKRDREPHVLRLGELYVITHPLIDAKNSFKSGIWRSVGILNQTADPSPFDRCSASGQ